MKQHLTKEESQLSQPTGIHFHFFLDKARLLPLLNDPIAAGIRISFGEQNGQRSFLTTAANSSDMDDEDLQYVALGVEEPGFDNFREASKIKSQPINFFNTQLDGMTASNTIFHPTSAESSPPPGFLPNSPSAWFNREDVLDLLNVPNSVGLRIFPGTVGILDSHLGLKIAMMSGEEATNDLVVFPTLIMISVDEAGKDLGTNNSEFANKPYVLSLLPCPPKCGSGDTTAPPHSEEEQEES
ncbi:MAG: hypothetical protein AAFP19_11500 [Bacteroidota bacterium]